MMLKHITHARAKQILSLYIIATQIAYAITFIRINVLFNIEECQIGVIVRTLAVKKSSGANDPFSLEDILA